jgi:hypothetical protein
MYFTPSTFRVARSAGGAGTSLRQKNLENPWIARKSPLGKIWRSKNPFLISEAANAGQRFSKFFQTFSWPFCAIPMA